MNWTEQYAKHFIRNTKQDGSCRL